MSTQDQKPPQIVELAPSRVDWEFIPSSPMREAKARFLVKLRKAAVFRETWTLSDLEQFTNDGRIRKWWPIKGFKDWFLDTEEFEAAAEIAAMEALAACREVMADPASQSRIAAAKLAFEIAKKMPKHQTASKGDETNVKRLSADPKRLKEFLAPAIKRAFSPEELLELAGADTSKNHGNGQPDQDN